VYDNFSTDRSVDICRKFSNVTVRQYQSNNEIRDELYLQIKNNCWKESKGKADWVIVCDIDEFLYITDLHASLESAKNKGYTLFKSSGYEMVGTHIPEENENLLQHIRHGVRMPVYDKTILFNPNCIEEINYDWGAHTCLPIGIIKENSTDAKLLHYKYLSAEYVIDRYKQMKARLSKKNKKMNLGIHYLLGIRQIQKRYANYQKNAYLVF